MTFPDSMKTTLLRIGAPLVLLGTKVRTTVLITPSEYLVWSETGEALVPLQEMTRNQDSYEIPLPCVDQAGFVDSSGAAIENFHFTVEVTVTGAGQVWATTKNIQPLSDQVELDFDLVPFDSPSAPILGNVGFVSSINGQTGAVTLSLSGGAAGAAGDSAYEVAVSAGFVGTEAEWLASLIGPQGIPGTPGGDGSDGLPGPPGVDGADGAPGAPGADGADGNDGAPGLSAYQVAVADGFVGDEATWLASLRGPDGTQGPAGVAGADGKSAYQLALDGGFIGTQAEWLTSLTGAQGAPGQDGASAYAVAVAGGFVGSQAEWLASLVGATGATGAAGADGADGDPATNLMWPVRKSDGTWPPRPTDSSDTTVIWIGPDPSPPIVESGTGGMLNNIDVRWVI